MNYFYIPAAIIAAILVIFILSLILKRPMRGFGLVFIILFLATWTGQLWITPFGPRTLGISWIPLIVVGMLLAFMILALSSDVAAGKPQKADREEGPIIVAGFFFWLILIVLIFAIIIGYYRAPVFIAN